jgi:hypothetical protein
MTPKPVRYRRYSRYMCVTCSGQCDRYNRYTPLEGVTSVTLAGRELVHHRSEGGKGACRNIWPREKRGAFPIDRQFGLALDILSKRPAKQRPSLSFMHIALEELGRVQSTAFAIRGNRRVTNGGKSGEVRP